MTPEVMNREQDATGGGELARNYLLALADDDQERALRVLAAGTPAETAWACAFLAARLEAHILEHSRGGRRRAAGMLRRHATAISNDILITCARLITQQSVKGN
jgi:hypothetical protein